MQINYLLRDVDGGTQPDNPFVNNANFFHGISVHEIAVALSDVQSDRTGSDHLDILIYRWKHPCQSRRKKTSPSKRWIFQSLSEQR